jgi:hypothetical protein
MRAALLQSLAADLPSRSVPVLRSLSPMNAVLEENFLKLIFVKICLIALVAKLFTSPFFEFYQVPF